MPVFLSLGLFLEIGLARDDGSGVRQVTRGCTSSDAFDPLSLVEGVVVARDLRLEEAVALRELFYLDIEVGDVV